MASAQQLLLNKNCQKAFGSRHFNEVIRLTGYTEFAELFGGITLLSVMQIILAGVFLYFGYKQVKDYLIT